MKKTFLSSVVLCLMAAFLVGCASTPKEPRTIKSNASKVKKIATAVELAENYEMEILFSTQRETNEKNFSLKDGNFISQDIFIARGRNSDEAVVFITLQDPKQTNSKSERIQFSYVSINGEKTSDIDKYYLEFGKLYLKNTSKNCELDSSGYELNAGAYDKFTRLLAGTREFLKDAVNKKFGLVLDEPINPVQQATIEKKE
ncbi:MAG: hypothetical protein IJ530_13040 [Treponema sp.]|uniref:hypothetical protein n=1 Tax=Treponema sp. TaxID=166 RepID=UPI001C1BB79E|nr:hypothetical protein [Treponema sp.]MBQ8680660.1 hypothetical protein [Treponema sp.]MBR1537835.1 hypothetical protein [Treponema sp.]